VRVCEYRLMMQSRRRGETPTSEHPLHVRRRRPEGDRDIDLARNLEQVYAIMKEVGKNTKEDCEIDESEHEVIDSGDQHTVQADASTAAVATTG